MKKFAALVGLLILALGVLVLPATAQDDLSTLTQFFPDNAPFYAVFRTDDAFIEMLDSVAVKFGALIPGGVKPGAVQALLDQRTASLMPGGTFAETIRPWLGDSAALGFYNLDPESLQGTNPPITIAIQITDQDKAEAFFDGLSTSSQYTSSEGDGYRLYSPRSSRNGGLSVIFRSDAVVITTDQNLIDSGGVLTSTLAENPDYGNATGMLPAASYGAVAYVDTPALLNAIIQAQMTNSSGSGLSSSDMSGMETIFNALTGQLKPEAVGLTLLDNRLITIDVAAPLNLDPSSPITLMTGRTPVDLAFTQHIPAGTPLVVQGTDLYHNGLTAIANLRALAEALPESANVRPQDVDTLLWAARFAVRGFTGLETDEAFGWMTGNYALYAGFTPAFSDSPSLSSAGRELPVDFGFAIEATDSAAAQQVFDGLARALVGLPADGISVTEETLDSGTQALNFTISSQSMPYPVEFLAATGNGVFVFGTRRMVNAALDPHNAGLDLDPSFIEATHTMVADPYTYFYLHGDGLQPIARLLTSHDVPLSTRSTGKGLKALFDLISSASISASASADGSSGVARFVWTLPE